MADTPELGSALSSKGTDFFNTKSPIPIGSIASAGKKSQESSSIKINAKDGSSESEIDSEESDDATEEDGGTDTESSDDSSDNKSDKDSNSKPNKSAEPRQSAKEDKIEDEPPDKTKGGRTISVFFNGEKIKLRTDSTLTHRVDGQPIKLTVEELLQGYSGNQSNEKKFKEVREAREKLEQEKQDLVSDLSDIHSILVNAVKDIKEGGGLSALPALFDAFGLDGFKIAQGLRRSILASARQLLEYSPEQLEWIERNEEVAYRESKIKKYEAQQAAARERDQMNARIEEACRKYGMDKKTFQEIFNNVYSAWKKGDYKAKDITPDEIGEYYQVRNSVDSLITRCIKGVDNSLVNDNEVKTDVFYAIKAFWERQGRLPEEDEIKPALRAYLNADTEVEPPEKAQNKRAFKPKPTQGKATQRFDRHTIWGRL